MKPTSNIQHPTSGAASYLKTRIGSFRPRLAIVLGSGLGGLADAVENRVEIAYGEIPGWPVSTAVGHAGVLVLGDVDGVPVAVLRGRAHVYEGVGAVA